MGYGMTEEDKRREWCKQQDTKMKTPAPYYDQTNDEEEVTEEEVLGNIAYEEEKIEDKGRYNEEPETPAEEEGVGEQTVKHKKNKDERELHECILAAYKNGIKNKSEIARKCKCSRQTVYRIAEKVWY